LALGSVVNPTLGCLNVRISETVSWSLGGIPVK
jgi:hypothetical protein